MGKQLYKILLLEDDYELAETIDELLKESGYSVDVVHTGNEAVDYSYDNKYDLYIFDINVPDITGIELLKYLRNAEDTTPTIFISALVDMNSIAKAFDVGAEDYIKKPFFPEELLIRVNAKFMQKSQSIIYKELEYLPARRELYLKSSLIPLSQVQECLCDVFMHNIGNILDKSILMECLISPSASALRVALNKLKQTTSLPIKNIRGVGYILEKS